MNISETVQIDIIRKSGQWQDILRCLSVLYGSRAGSLAIARDFGIDWSFIDMPLPAAKAMIEAELIRKTRKYEPRAVVKQVIWTGEAASGLIIPKVVIDIE
uniref:Type VI secretion system lysozyme-like protein n=1 Tax=Caudovirales sp. ct1Jx6 TaxID=2826765 RepID=A0A8S5MLU7_9CAUD|nr:MAG TPA: type VI secretion system lysozyme-like protein [Caudovirales sp. ct1Jx6]